MSLTEEEKQWLRLEDGLSAQTQGAVSAALHGIRGIVGVLVPASKSSCEEDDSVAALKAAIIRFILETRARGSLAIAPNSASNKALNGTHR